jgi:chemosensory pili system protein ChpB (putative protein-glutamate methylesterase)
VVKGIWLLAGSAGATGAIQQFLSSFRTCPPVAFLYAQHYDHRRQDHLRQLTSDNKLFQMELIEGERELRPGRVLIVPPCNRIAFASMDRVKTVSDDWQSEHTPDFNQLIKLFARVPARSKGMILFSGMGEDGCAGLGALTDAGCHIWAQDPETAVCRGIPSAAIASGLVQQTGSPGTLAFYLEQAYCQPIPF